MCILHKCRHNSICREETGCHATSSEEEEEAVVKQVFEQIFDGIVIGKQLSMQKFFQGSKEMIMGGR